MSGSHFGGQDGRNLLELLKDIGRDDGQRPLHELHALSRIVFGDRAHILRVVLDDSLERNIHD